MVHELWQRNAILSVLSATFRRRRFPISWGFFGTGAATTCHFRKNGCCPREPLKSSSHSTAAEARKEGFPGRTRGTSSSREQWRMSFWGFILSRAAHFHFSPARFLSCIILAPRQQIYGAAER